MQDLVARHQADALEAIQSERLIRQQLSRIKLEKPKQASKLKAL